MDNKKFAGYFIIGAKKKEEAERGQGLMLWSQKKPNRITRFFNKLLLNMFWVDKQVHEERLSKEAAMIDVKEPVVVENTTKVEMPKRKVYKKKTNGANSKRKDTDTSSQVNRE